jgi:signal transduction histidine kinase
MSDKPTESPQHLRSALDRVLVHDIKNMGFRLQMLLSNIDEHYEDPEFKRSVQELLRTTVERLDGMVERFSAHEDALLIKVALDLNSVIREVASSTRRGIDPNTGAAAQPTLSFALGVIPEIWGDPYLRDALESRRERDRSDTPRQGPRPQLHRRLAQASRTVVEIIDNGSGMSQEFLRDRLFKPFQTTKPQGVGPPRPRPRSSASTKGPSTS